MPGRALDPNTQYRVYLHTVANKYVYASVQQPKSEKEDGSKRTKYKVVHLGRVDSDNVFVPNSWFRLLPVNERLKYVFPEGIDISKITILNHPDYPREQPVEEQADGKEKMQETNETEPPTDSPNPKVPVSLKPVRNIMDQYNNKLYGSFWLLEQISLQKGVYDDLMETFKGNIAQVHEVMSLAFFTYLTGRCFNRFAKWQNAHQTLLDYPLTSPGITRLTQSITDEHRMTLIKLRLKRQPEGAHLDCDSTTKSGWGTCLVDLCWGNNKDNPKLRNTVEAYVYSLTTHEPVYYRSFPGYTSDISTVRTILSDLMALDIEDVVFIADRGYPSEENLAALVEADLPFLMCAKVGCKPIVSLLRTIKYDEDGIPTNMNYDEKRKLYYLQVDVPEYEAKLSDGTVVNMKGLKANLFMNPGLRVHELGILKRKIEDEKGQLKEAVEKKVVPSDIKKYNALFAYFKVTEAKDDNGQTTGISYALCEDKVNKERSTCGFFSSIMYKLNVDGAKALAVYKSRDEHEKNFDQLKNQMMNYVLRNSSEDGRNGRTFISFVGLIAVSTVRHAWKEKMQGKYESSLDMLDELEPIRYSEYPDGSTHLSSFTTKQVEICDACDVKVPPECMPATVRKAKERQAKKDAAK